MKRIGIIGSRRRNSKDDYFSLENKFLELYDDGDEIVSGGCPKGGDAMAETLAKKHQVPIKIYYAQWNKLGRGAGFARNTDIARDSDILIALVASDRKGGTEDTIKNFCHFKGKTEEELNNKSLILLSVHPDDLDF